MHFCSISNAYLISENPCFISQLFNKAGVGIFKAETLEELEQLARGEEVFENMVVTMKKLSEDEKSVCSAKQGKTMRDTYRYCGIVYLLNGRLGITGLV